MDLNKYLFSRLCNEKKLEWKFVIVKCIPGDWQMLRTCLVELKFSMGPVGVTGWWKESEEATVDWLVRSGLVHIRVDLVGLHQGLKLEWDNRKSVDDLKAAGLGRTYSDLFYLEIFRIDPAHLAAKWVFPLISSCRSFKRQLKLIMKICWQTFAWLLDRPILAGSFCCSLTLFGMSWWSLK